MHKKRPRKAAQKTEEQPLSREESRRRHKKRARQLMWKRLAIILAIFVLVFVVWRNWDTLAPDKLLAKVQDLIGDASGRYPVDISGANAHHLARSQNYTVLLSDSYLTYYNERGGEVTRYPCTYSTALLRTADKYVLVAEQGGKRLLLSTRSMTLVDMTLERNILAVDVNSKGQFAVLMQGTQTYAVELIVYDQKGAELYRRSRTSLASEVTLSEDGKMVALISLEAKDGVLGTAVEVFSLSSADPKALYTHNAADTLLYRLEFMTNDRLIAVGESGALVMAVGDSQPTAYAIDGKQLLGYAVAKDSAALVLRARGDTADGEVVVIDKEGGKLCAVPFTGEFRQLSAQDGQYLLLTNSMVQVITSNGAGKSATVAADGQQAVLYGNDAVVMGLSALQQYALA
jgi:hypothetical protein